MADQATGAVQGTGAAGALAQDTAHLEHNPGKRSSWVAVSIVIVGFVVGAIGFVLPPTPHWVIFWVGAGIAVIGCVATLFTRTFSEDWY